MRGRLLTVSSPVSSTSESSPSSPADASIERARNATRTIGRKSFFCNHFFWYRFIVLSDTLSVGFWSRNARHAAPCVLISGLLYTASPIRAGSIRRQVLDVHPGQLLCVDQRVAHILALGWVRVCLRMSVSLVLPRVSRLFLT